MAQRTAPPPSSPASLIVRGGAPVICETPDPGPDVGWLRGELTI